MLAHTYSLSIGQVIFLDEYINEVIPKEGEIDELDVDEYIAFLEAHDKLPARVLLNWKHSYSYSFLAQQHLYAKMHHPFIAILNTTKAVKIAFEALAMPATNWTYAFFESREEALDWLNRHKAM